MNRQEFCEKVELLKTQKIKLLALPKNEKKKTILKLWIKSFSKGMLKVS